MLRVAAWVVLGGWIALHVAGCASVSSDLERASVHYEEARYESVLVWLESLEPELATMTPPERSRFLYLRGMSAYRLGQREDAVHYLALARESVAIEPGSLSPSLQSTLERALVVLAAGTASATHALDSSR